MSTATQEGLRPSLPLLEYGELVDLDRAKKYGLNPILDPREIPVHPAVFNSPDVYTSEFAHQVWASVPDSIRKDVAAIEAKMGILVPVRVSSWGVSETKERLGRKEREPYLGFAIGADPNEKAISVQPTRDVNAINLELSDSLHYLTTKYGSQPPISKAKLKTYSIPETDSSDGGIITWYSHNVGMASLPLLLILRNYAIMHNNLGLQKVGAV